MGRLVGRRADGQLEESKIRLTKPSLAGTGAELGTLFEDFRALFLSFSGEKQSLASVEK